MPRFLAPKLSWQCPCITEGHINSPINGNSILCTDEVCDIVSVSPELFALSWSNCNEFLHPKTSVIKASEGAESIQHYTQDTQSFYMTSL